MEHYFQLHQQLGLMTYPLLICSALTLLIIVERLVHLSTHIGGNKKDIFKGLGDLTPDQIEQVRAVSIGFAKRKSLIFKGSAMLLAHRDFPKALREDAASLWLEDKRHQLNAGLRLLTLIGVISPLLGLLGTVLGLIDMFHGMAGTTGNVTPSDLADGLGIAMATTAVGLLIALPAIIGAQLLGQWADKSIARLENVMNFVNLWLEGMMTPPTQAGSANVKSGSANAQASSINVNAGSAHAQSGSAKAEGTA